MKNIVELCILEAKKSLKTDDVPIGAILMQNHDKIIAKSHNTREKNHDILGHAEIGAILKSCKKLKRWNLSDCELYVTLKPCSMCEEVIKQARISKVYYLLDKLDYKKEFSNIKVIKMDKNDDICIEKNEQMYLKMLQEFFQQKR